MYLLKKVLPAAAVVALAAAMCLYALSAMRAESTRIPVEETAVPTDAITEEVVVEAVALASEEKRYISPELQEGEEKTVIRGTAGYMEQEVKITYRNGEAVSRTVLSRRTVKQPSDTVILYGVDRAASVQTHPGDPMAEDGVLLTPEGDRLNYSRILSCTATAYSCEGRVGTTAIGTTARVGAVAVDPNYIPYGTELYIVSDDGAYVYGYATAEDCGNFRGYHIDLYFDTVDECWTFGRRSCTVYVLS